MHPIIMLSAVVVTSGLFGGGRAACPSGQCGSAVWQVPGYQYTYTAAVSQSQGTTGSIVQTAYYSTGWVSQATYPQPVAAAPAPAAQGWMSPGATIATSAPVYYYYRPGSRVGFLG
jgi:hypothetical protein